MKPLLATEIESLKTLKYPKLYSNKLDGIRCLIHPTLGPVTRSLKPIPNNFVREYLKEIAAPGLDGELIVGSPTAPDVFRNSTSGIMSYEGKPEFTFHVFDNFLVNDIFTNRYENILLPIVDLDRKYFELVDQIEVNNEEEVLIQEAKSIELGYEGGILRSPNSLYKYGRSTLREEIMLKVKRYQDDEATIVGFEEQLHNANEATINELGHTTRSSHKENMIGKNTLGAIIVKCDKFQEEFNIGTGFNDILRRKLWEEKTNLIGKVVTFKYFLVGIKDRPRFPVFKGFRDINDISS